MNLRSRILLALGFTKQARDLEYTNYYNTPDKFDLENRMVPAELQSVIEKFGRDAIALLYRKDGLLIGSEMEAFLWPKQDHGCLGSSYWHERHPLNFPGPFYTGQTDTCGTGPIEAPANVLVDDNAQEFIFRQATNMQELLEVVNAGLVEVLSSYSCDGNSHWTYALCKEWWRNRHDVTAELRKPRAVRHNGKWTKLWNDYLQGDAEIDLRRYCYFLEHGQYPTLDGVHLPPL